MSRFSLAPSQQSGTTLVETMIALVIMTIIMAGAFGLWRSYNRAAKSHEATESLGAEMTEVTSTLLRSWVVRTRPPGFTGSYTATQKGFSLFDAVSKPCTTRCTKLVIDITKSSGATERITIDNQCLAPGAVTGLSRLTALNIGAAMSGNCLICKPGKLPVVTFTSKTNAASDRRFPHNGAQSAATFRLTDMLGMSVCFEQTGIAPLVIDQRAYALNLDLEGDVLKTTQRTVIMPFDNFGNVRLEAR